MHVISVVTHLKSIAHRFRSRLWLGAVGAPIASLLLSATALALPPDVRLSQLYHTGWTARDGAPTGIESMVQTRDGYLWLGNSAGLFRFDGVRFERIEGARDKRLGSNNVYSLWAPPDGGLWIGYRFGGASFMRDGEIVNYGLAEGLPAGTVWGFAQEPSGILWAATSRGLMRLEGRRWMLVSQESGLPKTNTKEVHVDVRGTVWVVANNAVMFLRRGSHQFELAGITTDADSSSRFLDAPDGVTWLFNDKLGLRALHAVDSGYRFEPRWLGRDLIDLGQSGLLVDRDGELWIPTVQGIRRFKSPASLTQIAARGTAESADIFGRSDGLTGEHIFSALQDAEGNVWIGTSGGLDKFRAAKLVKVDVPPSAQYFSLSPGENGSMWVGTSQGQLYRASMAGTGHPIAEFGSFIGCLYRDPSGILWVGSNNAIWQEKNGRWNASRRIIRNDQYPDANEIQAIAKDTSGAMWVSVVGAGVYRVVAESWTLWGGRADLPKEPATVLATDNGGRLWLGYVNSRIALLDGGRLTIFTKSDGVRIGTTLALQTHGRSVWVGGEQGLMRFDGSAFHEVTLKDHAPFLGISGIVETSAGDLWLNTSEGAVHIDASEVQKVIGDPAHPVHFELLNYLDGMAGTPSAIRPLPSMTESSDGQLWFSTTNGVLWHDPKRTARNNLPPKVFIEGITADGKSYDPTHTAQLPVKVRNLAIAYTGLSFSIPERVQFRYRLEGGDSSWEDVGMRREAYFTDLAPGRYTFHVVASNEDGVWNETGATLQFVIPPTFFQTRWFFGLCILAAAGLMWILFLLRLQQLKARVRWQLEARLVERERIARDLHDTFLQGVQGLMLRFQSVTERIPKEEPARRLMEQALDRADQVLADGRDRVTELRDATYQSLPLPEALRIVGDDLGRDHVAEFSLSVEGEPRDLHPIVREESYRVAAEAITNAYRHAHARHIKVHIEFGKGGLSVRVADDGHGFDALQRVPTTPSGHWGLKGMRERAARIRGQLEISSDPATGSIVALHIPARRAYAKGPGGWGKLRQAWNRVAGKE